MKVYAGYLNLLREYKQVNKQLCDVIKSIIDDLSQSIDELDERLNDRDFDEVRDLLRSAQHKIDGAIENLEEAIY